MLFNVFQFSCLSVSESIEPVSQAMVSGGFGTNLKNIENVSVELSSCYCVS